MSTVAAFVLGIAGIVVVHLLVGPSALERAYRACRPCGMDNAEIDGVIDNIRHSRFSREENLRRLLETFEDVEDAEACQSCAEAILDAGGRS